MNIGTWLNKWGKLIIGIKPYKNPNNWPNSNVIEFDGIIESINCGSTSNTGTIWHAWQVSSGTTTTISYTGGNGGSYPNQTINSTGVTGLKATLKTGYFLSGNGSLTYTITGMASNVGIASFTIQLGGKSCTFTRNVIDIG